MRKLEIDWMGLEAAFQTGMDMMMRNFLDLETGKVISITEEVNSYLEDEEIDESLPDWMQEEVQKAQQVEEGYSKRYISIPERDNHEEYRDMERFIATVRDARLRDQLWRAISGRGAFRYFRDVLAQHPAERERWFAFSDRCLRERMLEWLESEGIEPTNPIELPEMPEPEEVEETVNEELLEDLTLLVIYLSSWEERIAPDLTTRRAWKGYLFEVLDALEEKGYIDQSRRAKSLTLTEEGVARARELAALYTNR